MASIIKADNIQKVSDGTNIIKKCGSTTTIGSGACSPIVICGSTVTLGRCGGTVTLASGATQSGFGQTYSATSYCTTVKTAPFTAVAGKGYFVNTTCAAVTVTLPATPTAGDIISLKDYGGTWQTNNLTVCNNGSKINGVCNNSILNTKAQSVTLIYVDGTKGWQDIQDSTSNVSAGFTYNVQYLVVAGGGGATGPSCYGGGGGGAGGFRTATCFPVSSLSGSYTVTVGAGGSGLGPGATCMTNKGSDSVFSSITSAAGGGAGGQGISGPVCNHNGGSGGGSGGGPYLPTDNAGGLGNTPPVSPPQGNPGGDGSVVSGNVISGGGGGAGGAGQGNPLPSNSGGNGGVGSPTSILGSSPAAALYGTPGPNPGKYFAGGGAGRGGYSGNTGTAGCGGAGGGGGTPSAGSGTVNTGGGGGGDRLGTGGGGGSGIVILKYTTACASPTVSGGTAYTCGTNTIRVFTADGTFTA